MAMNIRRHKSALVRSVAASVCAVSMLFLPGFHPVSADAYASSTIVIEGHGYGHGRGLSQYGALGYALAGRDHNWILNHYYSNTTAGSVSDSTTIGVSLESTVNNDMIVVARRAYSVGGIGIPAYKATLVRKVGGNTFDIFTANNCAGGGGWQKVATRTGDVVAVPPSMNPGDDINAMLDLCQTNTRTYRGTLAMIDNGASRVINNVSLESYLRGVIPRESSASWSDLGGGAGANALRAQAVAARSYAVSSPRPRWTTCDTTTCQVYGGAFLNGAYIEDSRTNSAIATTANQVRVLKGAVARTEFSSSSGGWTAGGTYPAVVDDGDAVSQNGNHNWSTLISVAAIENAYPAIGSFNNISIDNRNGLGDWGGRVTALTLTGSSGSVTVSGLDFRMKVGLKSDWFRIAGTPSGGVDGYWMAGADGGLYTFGDIPFLGSAGNIPLQKPIVGSARTSDDGGYWLVASDGGIFTFGNAGFFGSTGAMRLNKPIVGMAATPSGNGYWLVASDGGIFTFGDAAFHGSTGAMTLNQPIAGMASTGSGNGYWLVATDGGIFTFGDASYFGSMPGSGVRGQQAVSIMSSETGNGYLIATISGNVYNYGDAPWMGGIANGYRGRVVSVMTHRE